MNNIVSSILNNQLTNHSFIHYNNRDLFYTNFPKMKPRTTKYGLHVRREISGRTVWTEWWRYTTFLLQSPSLNLKTLSCIIKYMYFLLLKVYIN